MRLLFIENRQKTPFWEALATGLAALGHEIDWIVQNPAFAPRSGRVHALGFPRASRERLHAIAPSEQAALEHIATTDRVANYFGGATDHYPHYWSAIGTVLDRTRPDVIVGEATLFHELMTLAHAKRLGIPFVVPHSSRYPAGRFCFFLNDTFTPLAGSGEAWSDSQARALITLIQSGGMLPNYIAKAAGMPHWFRPRLGTVPRVLAARIGGERYNTPSAFSKLGAMIERHRLRRDWERLAVARASTLTAPNKLRILYPLQLQPEVSLEVYANAYRNQVQTLGWLLEQFSDEVSILVKPNPKSDMEIDARLLGRVENNSRLIPLSHALSMRQALPHASGVVTVNSTVGIEALIVGWPIFILHNYLEGFGGPSSSPQAASVKDWLQCLREGKPCLGEAVKLQLIKALVARSYPGLVSDPLSNPECMAPSNIEQVVAGFVHLLQRLGAECPRKAAA